MTCLRASHRQAGTSRPTIPVFAIGALALVIGSAVGTAVPVSAADSLFTPNSQGYVGGRGLITAEGPTGMFLNPTSGTLGKGQLTAQFFSTVLEENFNNKGYYNALASYGMTDWLEVGAVGYLRDLDKNKLSFDALGEPFLEPDGQSIAAAGPLLRVRVLKDEAWWPEISVGGYLREGHHSMDRQTIFGAAFKRFLIHPKGFLRSIGFHAGFRQFWQDAQTKIKDSKAIARSTSDAVGYFGGEIELPNNFYLVSEVSTKEDASRFVPFSVGAQLRLPGGYGLSLAALQPGDQRQLAIYVGIGINF